MLTTIIAAADRLIVAGGSITDKNSALFHPTFKYSHHQTVAGITFDIIVEVLLASWLAYVSWKHWGPAAKRRAKTDEAYALAMKDGTLLGVEPWVWSLVCFASITIVVLISVLFIY